MASVVEICNRALTKLGQGEQYITTLADSTKEARALNRVYENARDLVLRETDWKCCIKRTQLDLMPGNINRAVYLSTYDRYIAVGDNGVILTSTGGITWDIQQSGVTTNLNDICLFGTTTYTLVAVGDNGVILTSSDGITWTARTSGTTRNIYGVAANAATLLVACGSAGLILSSTDYTTWTSRTSGKSSILHSCYYGNSLYVVVGDSGVILTSADGTTWAAATSGVTTNLYGVGYSALVSTTFIVCGASGIILTSTDGATWTAGTSGVTADLYSVVIYTTAAVTGACIITGKGTILSSTNFVTWTSRSIPSGYSDNELRGMAYSISNLYFCFGEGIILQTRAIATAWTSISFTPAVGYDYHYILPNDLLKMLSVNTDGSETPDLSMDWRIEGEYFYTDEESAYIEYLAKITDTTRWSIHLIEAVITRVAMEVCYEITGSNTLKRELWQEYGQAIKEARSSEYRNQYVEDEAPIKWKNAGRL